MPLASGKRSHLTAVLCPICAVQTGLLERVLSNNYWFKHNNSITVDLVLERSDALSFRLATTQHCQHDDAHGY